jgi:hypothetical protein
MQIPKDKILEVLRQSGDDQKASQADEALPDPVDTERDHGTLEKLGVDATELFQKFSGAGIPHLSE